MSTEHVTLVNERDEAIGTMEKLEAHRQGVLHRAFSVFVWDDAGRLLLQRRALGKYHSGGLWTNTCCSHPRPDEALEAAAQRRLQEEMGIAPALQHRFSFVYKAPVGNGLTEHELDHVFFGVHSGGPVVDPTEVMDWRFADIVTIDAELHATPERYTAWFLTCWPRIHALRTTA